MTSQMIRNRLAAAVIVNLALVATAVAQPYAARTDTTGAEYIHAWNRALVATVVADYVPNPPAARLFAYLHIAAYEAARHADPMRPPLGSLIRSLPAIPSPDSACTYDWRVAAMAAYKKVAAASFFRLGVVDSLYYSALAELESRGLTYPVRECSERYGVSVANSVIGWMQSDGYSSMPREYVPPQTPGAWETSPPFMLPPEVPYWGTIRPLLGDSLRQIRIPAPIAFSTDSNSAYFRAAKEVLDSGMQPSPENVHATSFWHDTPLIVGAEKGMPPRLQMSAPGHWLLIAGNALSDAGSSLVASLETYAAVAAAMHDATIAAWAEKYRTNGARPFSYIARNIAADWFPPVPTPPSPEYPSERAALAGSAATLLTNLLGERPFLDSTEAPYGWGARTFRSFNHAADEATMSGFYGGVQYRHSGDAGRALGHEIAEMMLRRWRDTTVKTAGGQVNAR